MGARRRCVGGPSGLRSASRVVSASLIGALASAAGCAPLPAGDATRPDIVLVSIDSLRADHVGSYGYTRQTTPNLDALAAEGLRFADARAASPWTLPSHLTMFTGLWPTDHQVVEDTLALAPSVPVVTEALREAGYGTAGFVSTHYVHGRYGFSRGFQSWSDYDIRRRTNLAHDVRVDRLVDDALAWTKAHGDGRPVFLFVHVYDVHYPYFPPEPWDEKFDPPGTPEELRYRSYHYYKKSPLTDERLAHQVAQYDESLAWVDHELGRLVDAWDDSDRAAYWIVTSDHGEELGERGSWGHGQTLHPEALAIPLLVAGPGVAPAVRAEQVGTVDLAATIAAMAGLSWAHGPGVDLRGPVPDRPFYAETSPGDTARVSIRRGDARLDVDLAAGTRALYDLAADPAERQPVRTDDGTAAALEAALFQALGGAWTADAGTVSTDGWVWTPGGAPAKELVGPAVFGLYPPDAQVRLVRATEAAAAPAAPAAPAAGVVDDPVAQPQGASDGAIPAEAAAPADPGPPIARARGTVDAPADGPLRYAGPRNAVSITVDAETRAQLEALGYVKPAEK